MMWLVFALGVALGWFVRAIPSRLEAIALEERRRELAAWARTRALPGPR